MTLVKYRKYYKKGIEYEKAKNGNIVKLKFYFIDKDDKAQIPAIYSVIFAKHYNKNNLDMVYPCYDVTVESFGMPLKDFDWLTVDPWITFRSAVCRFNMGMLKNIKNAEDLTEIQDYFMDLIFYLSLTIGKEIVYLLNYVDNDKEKINKVKDILEKKYKYYFSKNTINKDMDELEQQSINFNRFINHDIC